MLIKKLELKGYKRLSLSGITKIIYTPVQNIQVILGRNMSGKSQLLRQLNPLPANITQEFNPGGYKDIEIEHNKHYYRLHSDSAGHNFELDGKELNSGHTKHEQLKLVKEHFNLTPEVIEFMLGNVKFTDMGPTERKQWITDMSNVDYSYVIGRYLKLKEDHKIVTGSIKYVETQLLNVKSKILDDKILEYLKTDIEFLDVYRETIRNRIKENGEVIELDDNRIAKDIEKLEEINTKLTNVNIEDIDNQITKTKIETEKMLVNIDNVTKELARIEKLPAPGTIKETRARLEEITNKIQELRELKDLDIEDEYVDEVASTFTTYYNDIVSILNLDDNIAKYKQVNRQETIELVNRIDKAIDICRYRLRLIKEEKDRLENNTREEEITCEKCGNKWMYDNSKKLQELEQLTKKYTDHIYNIKITQKEDELRKQLEGSDAWLDYKENKLASFFKQSKTLYTILNLIAKECDMNVDTTASILNAVDYVKTRLSSIAGLSKLLQQQGKIEHLLSNYKDITQEQQTYNKERTEQLTLELAQLTATHKQLEDQLLELKEIKNLVIEKDKYEKHIEDYVTLCKENYNIATKEMFNNTINNIYNYVTEERTKSANQLAEQLNVKQLYDKYKTDLDQLTKEKEVLEKMIRAIGPTDGLIAKSMSSSINNIVADMNTIISSIWTYPVEILPCNLEEGDITYRFKVKVNNDEVVKDVSNLSSSMKEIVNLAFRLVYYRYKGLIGYPLYLDEFGNTFDKEHRTQAYNVIDKLISAEAGQMYIISHYASLYGSISNCDINILDKENIDMSGITEYNDNFILHYD